MIPATNSVSTLFRSLSAEQAALVAASVVERTVPAGAVLFRVNEPGSCCYIITDGRVTIYAGDSAETVIAQRGPGDCIGEISLFTPGNARTATGITTTATTVLELSHDVLSDLLREQPQVAAEIVRTLALRMHEEQTRHIGDLEQKNAALAEAYRQLQQAQAALVERERIAREMELARDIQRGMLPASLPQLPGVDLAALMEPARQVGGDFYDVVELGDGRLGFVVADVSDKGIAAAMFMVLCRTLLRSEAARSTDPAVVVQAVNEQLLEMNDAGMFVTLLYGIFDSAECTFHYARAGHELPLLFAADGTPVPVPTADGQLLGLFPDPLLDVQQLAVPPGGYMVLYTDGVTDAVDPAQVPFGLGRFGRLLQQLPASLTAQHVCDATWAAIAAHQADADQFDDVTLLVLRLDASDVVS